MLIGDAADVHRRPAPARLPDPDDGGRSRSSGTGSPTTGRACWTRWSSRSPPPRSGWLILLEPVIDDPSCRRGQRRRHALLPARQPARHQRAHPLRVRRHRPPRRRGQPARPRAGRGDAVRGRRQHLGHSRCSASAGCWGRRWSSLAARHPGMAAGPDASAEAPLTAAWRFVVLLGLACLVSPLLFLTHPAESEVARGRRRARRIVAAVRRSRCCASPPCSTRCGGR